MRCEDCERLKAENLELKAQLNEARQAKQAMIEFRLGLKHCVIHNLEFWGRCPGCICKLCKNANERCTCTPI